MVQVTSIIACMLEAGSSAVVGHLFGDCDLLGWLLNAPSQCEPEQRPGDTRCVCSLSNPGSPGVTYETHSIMALWTVIVLLNMRISWTLQQDDGLCLWFFSACGVHFGRLTSLLMWRAGRGDPFARATWGT